MHYKCHCIFYLDWQLFFSADWVLNGLTFWPMINFLFHGTLVCVCPLALRPMNQWINLFAHLLFLLFIHWSRRVMMVLKTIVSEECVGVGPIEWITWTLVVETTLGASVYDTSQWSIANPNLHITLHPTDPFNLMAEGPKIWLCIVWMCDKCGTLDDSSIKVHDILECCF